MFLFSSRRRHTSCALVTGVQTCALPIYTGFGNALTLQRLVRHLERAGAAAVQIEDQSFPKRCGHMAGKRVVPLGEAVGRIKAAVDARTAMRVVARSEERRVGKDCVSTCRYRWSPYH